MQVRVRSISPCDHHDLPHMEAVVEFYDNKSTPHNSAKVSVFIQKSELGINEIKSLAIKTAREFLKCSLNESIK